MWTEDPFVDEKIEGHYPNPCVNTGIKIRIIFLVIQDLQQIARSYPNIHSRLSLTDRTPAIRLHLPSFLAHRCGY